MNLRNALGLCILIAISGCGGLGGESATLPKVTIEWPALTRGVEAPSYASSANILITPESGAPSVTWTVDRPIDQIAHTIAYEGPRMKDFGPAVLTVKFYNQPSSTVPIATAQTSVNVEPNGTILREDHQPLGTVSFSSELTNLNRSFAGVSIGQTTTARVGGDHAGKLIAIPQHLVTLTALSGGERIQIENLDIAGIQEGPVHVQAEFEQKTLPFDFYVAPRRANAVETSVAANDIAWDATRNGLWVSLRADLAHPNSIALLNPATLLFEDYISIGGAPNKIAISSDGTIAYVGVGSSVAKVDLVAKSVLQTYPMTFTHGLTGINQLTINPTDKNQVGVVSQRGGNAIGPAVINGNQVLLSTIWQGMKSVVWMTDSTICAVAQGFAVNYQVSPSVLSQTSSNAFQSNDTEQCIYLHNKIYSSGKGFVYTPGGGSVVGQTYFETGVPNYKDIYTDITSDQTGELVWQAGNQVHNSPTPHFPIRAFSTTTLVQSGAISLPAKDSEESIVRLQRYGTTNIAVLTTERLYLVSNCPGL